MSKYLKKDSNGNWNTLVPVPSEKMSNVNCHKFVLYAVGKISWDEMISDPKPQKAAGLDFTFGDKVSMLSEKSFALIKDAQELLKLAGESCELGQVYVGQIKDSVTGEMAHSFIVERKADGSYECSDKQGFKNYLFSVHNIETLLDFVNDKGEKSYQNQEWRFVPVSDIIHT